jgi:hypothetical protein
MSRSGYSDDLENWSLIRWRGAAASAIRGRRGQAFLREMLDALDALPEKRLIAGDLVREGEVCALGAVAVARGTDVSDVDPEDHEAVAAKFGITHTLACEVEYINDEIDGHHFEVVDFASGERRNRWRDDTPEERFERVRAWVASQIRED